MFFLRSLFSVLLMALILVACNKNSSTTLTPTAIDSLKTVFLDINSEIDTAWNVMMKDDDEKLDNLKRILQEVEYSGNYNRLKLESLINQIEALVSIRYDQRSMSDSELINKYDDLTTQVMGNVTNFTTSLAQFEQYPLMGQLLQEVFEADDRVLRFRIDYDKTAKQFNSFIETHEPEGQVVAKQKILQPKPVF